MSHKIVDRTDYWASFYSAKSRGGRLMPPSQFAAFVAQELEPESVIFDVGCGNGRDSLFFAELGFKVIALDASGDAIAFIEKSAIERGLDNIKFIESDVTAPDLGETILQLKGLNCCVYARFFLHAINDAEQAKFLGSLSKTLQPGNRVAFEYRTNDDQYLTKDAPPHYRRYQSSEDLNGQLQDLAFAPVYVVEGQGYAKYKSDDAVVARCIFEKVD